MIARLFAGAAHGWSCPVPEGTSCVHISMAAGKPTVFVTPSHPGAEESLTRGQGRWEMYVQVVGSNPDREGRYAFYCPQSLTTRLAAQREEPREARSEPDGLVEASLERLRDTPAPDDEANAHGWAELECLLPTLATSAEGVSS